MDAKRGSEEYVHKLHSFVEFVACTTRQGKILCPCRNYRHRHMLNVEVVHHHLYSFGMVKNYRTWVFNGEFESTPTTDRKSTRLNSSHRIASRMPSSA